MTEQTHFYEHELGIYLQGMAGIRPSLAMTLAELESLAREKIGEKAYGYVAGGAGLEDAVSGNRRAFEKWHIVPRMCKNVATRSWHTQVLGTRMKAPIMLAPVGVQGIVHPEAEIAVARAASSTETPMVLSSVSSKSLEDVATTIGNTPHWFQLYPPKDMALANSFIQRAEAAGYSAIVLTVDTRFIGWRARDLRDAYLPFLEGEGIANYISDPVFRAALEETPEENMRGAIAHWTEIYSDPAHDWDSCARLRDMTKLPMAIKGILHPDDARKALELGFEGIVVSNHGGRQVDGSIASLDALPAIVDAVGDKVDIILDSGIRCGADIIRACALGAKAVLIGRPYIWGLAVAGTDGVSEVIQRLLAEFDCALALSGVSRRDEITPDLLQRIDP